MAGSKNARSGSRTQIFKCACGAEIKNKSIFQNSKMKHYAECTGCGKTASRIGLIKVG